MDAITIFTRGGVVLWSYYFIKLEGKPINTLIKTILIKERNSEQFAFIPPYNLKWKFMNKLDLILVMVYQGFYNLIQLDLFLDNIGSEFLNNFAEKSAISTVKDYSSFNEKFLKLSRKLHQHQKPHASLAQNTKTLPPQKKDINLNVDSNFQSKSSSITTLDKDGSVDNDEDNDPLPSKTVLYSDSTEISEPKLPTLEKHQPPISPQLSKQQYKFGKESSKPKPKEKKEPKKKKIWETIDKPLTQNDMDQYDYSQKKTEKVNQIVNYQPQDPQLNDSESDSDETHSDDKDGFNEFKTQATTSKFRGFFNSVTSLIQNFTGNVLLTEEILKQPLAQFKATLMTKNVAEEIAEMVTKSVETKLVGLTSPSFTSVYTMVKGGLKDSIERILTPKKPIDILKAALETKEQGKVYSIVFLGVNGVGKSTNLAKVCYYLKNKGLKVIIIACDTFRSGAVEQLKHHARCLDVHLYEKGYGKDAAQIAKEGLKYAAENSYNVALIDTAGRMQDNLPLMRSLGRLIATNKPDLVLFVGEALVGNDGVDQIKKFDKALQDMSSITDSRKIDGILLTKFDTVDDKVGAALSMVYITGQPIIFIGVGQKYPDLKKLKAKNCVQALLD